MNDPTEIHAQEEAVRKPLEAFLRAVGFEAVALIMLRPTDEPDDALEASVLAMNLEESESVHAWHRAMECCAALADMIDDSQPHGLAPGAPDDQALMN